MFGFAVGGLFFWIVVSAILSPFVTPPWWSAPLIWGVGFALSACLNEWMEAGSPRRRKNRRAQQTKRPHP